ncbi:MAG: T9SS type A sorting domain-containing protein [FCB group bacterium]|nr:T9SS type A sorting domain-containing protein [FCB group bacterium]
MKKLTLLLLLIITFCLYADWNEIEKILASDGDGGDRFGYSVSVSGEYTVIGAYCDDENGSLSGSAYIFQRNGSNWTEQAKLTASDGADGDYFGRSVSISGDCVVIGASHDDDNGFGSGSAYIFQGNGSNWTEQAKLTASDGAVDDYFGWSVSISGDYAVIGASHDDDNGFNSGSAYIFQRNGNIWTEQAKLTASDGAECEYFSRSVSISGDYAVFGADEDYNKEGYYGSAYIFQRTGSNWIEQVKLTASDGIDDHYFGRSVSISGDCVVIGAFGDDDNGFGSGSAYIFQGNGSNWAEQAKLTASDGAGNDRFGYSVSISGDYAVFGAYQDDDNGTCSGSAYIFHKDGLATNELLVNDNINTYLTGNFPNPFNPTTTIEFSIQNDSKIEIVIFNIKGQKVISLVNESFERGNQSVIWNGDDESGEPVSSGVYLYKLNVNGKTEAVKKCLLLK